MATVCCNVQPISSIIEGVKLHDDCMQLIKSLLIRHWYKMENGCPGRPRRVTVYNFCSKCQHLSDYLQESLDRVITRDTETAWGNVRSSSPPGTGVPTDLLPVAARLKGGRTINCVKYFYVYAEKY